MRQAVSIVVQLKHTTSLKIQNPSLWSCRPSSRFQATIFSNLRSQIWMHSVRSGEGPQYLKGCVWRWNGCFDGTMAQKFAIFFSEISMLDARYKKWGHTNRSGRAVAMVWRSTEDKLAENSGACFVWWFVHWFLVVPFAEDVSLDDLADDGKAWMS